MSPLDYFAFVAFPYLCLTTFAVGHAYRYVTDRFAWNAHSSELIEKDKLLIGAYLFHFGIIGTFLGHAGGLLIPQRLYDMVGINGQAHTTLAYYAGALLGVSTFTGALLLLSRRLFTTRIRLMTSVSDFVILTGFVFVSGVGTYAVFFGHFYVLDTVAPWIRSIVTLQPDPSLMATVPLTYKVHVLAALALLGYSPFTRLVHIWSIPVFYLLRSPLVFRRRVVA
ncbi:MAG: respiratory nitrate reductase subunit gamma [Hyphomicrobiales bacterium]